MRYSLIFCILFILSACANTETDEKSQAHHTQETQLSLVKPPLTADSIQWLANNVGDVLIDFYNYEATMTMKKDQGSQRAAYFISPESVSSDISACQPFAAIVFTGKNGVLYESEIFMDGECSFIRFRKGSEIVHHNKITKEAFDFFTDILNKYKPPVKG